MRVVDWLRRLFGYGRTAHVETVGGAARSQQSISPASGSPAVDLQPEKPPKVVVVGIDFGTSGTKVVIGDTATNRHHPLIRNGASRKASFIFPSMIGISSHRVFFCGSAPARLKGSVTQFSSFKVCLACQHGLASCRRCAYQAQEPGCFVIRDGAEVDRIDAEHLSTWYLAFIMGCAKREIAKLWGGAFDLQLIFNVGAPIDQWNAVKGLNLFTRVAFYAEKLSDNISNGARLSDLRSAYDAVRADYAEIPNESERVVFVQPETAAGLMSFVTSPRVERGLYGIVDVGAGTTDVSFFRLADFRPDEPRRMSFYEAKTEVVGAGDLDRCLAYAALSRVRSMSGSMRSDNDPEVLAGAKLAKEQMDTAGECAIRIGSTVVNLSRAAVEQTCEPKVSEMVSAYIRTNHLAFRKEPRVDRWRKFTVLTLGGGTRCSLVYDRFQNARPSPYNDEIRFQRIPFPGDFYGEGATPDSFEWLAVAYGLSFPPLDFPDILTPDSVAPLERSVRTAAIPDRDEQYPP